MNILFLTLSRMTDISNRGIYTDLLREFVKRGHDIYVATPFERRFHRKTHLSDSEKIHILGIKTLNIQKTNIIEKGVGTILLEYQYSRAISKYWGGIQFDLILYSTPPITFNRIIRSVKNRINAKTYLLLKDIFPQNAVDLGMFSRSSLFYRFFRHKEQQLYQLSDYIGCMSPENVAYVLNHNTEIPKTKVEICPNSIELLPDTITIDKVAVLKKHGIPSDRTLFIYGGNLGKPQGIDFLIQVLDYNANRENCFFCIVGSGTESRLLKKWYAKRKPLNVLVKDILPKQDYDLLVRTADVGMIFLDRRFTIPNFPSRLLSYLEAKLPILLATDINTDIGRIAEYNKFGLWAESGDLIRFNKHLEYLIANVALRESMGNNGYRFLQKNYTVDKTADIILSHSTK